MWAKWVIKIIEKRKVNKNEDCDVNKYPQSG